MGKTKYILRLDDASPYMARAKWAKIEKILDAHGIEPIVGIVPDCTDVTIKYEPYDESFFGTVVNRWRKKNWTVAQHGLHHLCYKNSDGVATEFAGRGYEEQLCDIKRGYGIMCAEGCRPVCFFAPCHTFDSETIRACRDSKFFNFISDGCSLFPFEDNGMKFLPNLFDTPKNLYVPGVITFVCHPSNTDDSYCAFLDDFLDKNAHKFVNAEEYMKSFHAVRRRGILDKTLNEVLRIIRKKRKGK